jgi:hypothetical protein
MYYVVSLGLDERARRILRPELAGAAAKFLPHISIKGRFELRNAQLHDLYSVISNEFAGLKTIHLHVGPEIRISPTLVWRELSRPEEVNVLRSLHMRVNDAVLQSGLSVIEKIPEKFRNEGFRPHISTQWYRSHESRPRRRGSQRALEVLCTCLEIYHYEGLPFYAHVTRTEVRKLLST